MMNVFAMIGIAFCVLAVTWICAMLVAIFVIACSDSDQDHEKIPLW